MTGRPKTHPDTSPAHETPLSDKAIDLLRRVADRHRLVIPVDALNPTYRAIAKALIERGLISNDIFYKSTPAGRALIYKIDGKAK